MTAQFSITRIDPYYRFHFEGELQNSILFSRLFRTLGQCKKGIEELVENVRHSERIELITDKTGNYTFTVRNKKGRMIASSTTFYAASTRDYAIRQLRMLASTATVLECATQNNF